MAERELKATLAEKRDGVGIITLNRPEKLNAINQDIMDDLYYLFDAYEAVSYTHLPSHYSPYERGGNAWL